MSPSAGLTCVLWGRVPSGPRGSPGRGPSRVSSGEGGPQAGPDPGGSEWTRRVGISWPLKATRPSWGRFQRAGRLFTLHPFGPRRPNLLSRQKRLPVFGDGDQVPSPRSGDDLSLSMGSSCSPCLHPEVCGSGPDSKQRLENWAI